MDHPVLWALKVIRYKFSLFCTWTDRVPYIWLYYLWKRRHWVPELCKRWHGIACEVYRGSRCVPASIYVYSIYSYCAMDWLKATEKMKLTSAENVSLAKGIFSELQGSCYFHLDWRLRKITRMKNQRTIFQYSMNLSRRRLREINFMASLEGSLFFINKTSLLQASESGCVYCGYCQHDPSSTWICLCPRVQCMKITKYWRMYRKQFRCPCKMCSSLEEMVIVNAGLSLGLFTLSANFVRYLDNLVVLFVCRSQWKLVCTEDQQRIGLWYPSTAQKGMGCSYKLH